MGGTIWGRRREDSGMSETNMKETCPLSDILLEEVDDGGGIGWEVMMMVTIIGPFSILSGSSYHQQN